VRKLFSIITEIISLSSSRDVLLLYKDKVTKFEGVS
jgi:hypothetical protein